MGGFDVLFQFLSKGSVEELSGPRNAGIWLAVTCFETEVVVLFSSACPIHLVSFIKVHFSSKISTGQVDFSVHSNELHVGTKSLRLQERASILHFWSRLSCSLFQQHHQIKVQMFPVESLLQETDERCLRETNSLNAFVSNIRDVFSFLKNC